MSKKVLAVDIGGTKTVVALVDSELNILESTEFETLKDRKAAVDAIKKAADEFDPEKELPLGIVICGLLSIDGRTLFLAPNLGWKETPFDELFAALNRKYVVANDGTAAAWASYTTEAAPDVEHMLSVTLGTGVGGGLVINGSLLFGAGELGHVKVQLENGPLCRCGKKGCLEAMIGGKHIPARAREWFGLEVKSAEELFTLARGGSGAAADCWKKIGGILGFALSNVVNLNGVQEISIGGTIAGASDFFLDETVKCLRENVMIAEYQNCNVYISKWRNNMSLIGASSLVLNSPVKTGL